MMLLLNVSPTILYTTRYKLISTEEGTNSTYLLMMLIPLFDESHPP